MSTLRYFMWEGQHQFQDSAAYLAQQFLEPLDSHLAPDAFLVGFRVADDAQGIEPICVSPDDCRFQPEVFRHVLRLTEEIAETDPLACRKTLKGMGKIIVLTTVAFGVGLIVFPLSHALPVSLLILVGMGCAQMVHTGGINTVLHIIVQDDKRGRVMSYYTMALVGMTPLGSLLAGILADRVGAPMTVLLGGPFCLFGSWIFARKLPHLKKVAIRTLDERKAMQATAALALATAA